jgi:hypothetical protein
MQPQAWNHQLPILVLNTIHQHDRNQLAVSIEQFLIVEQRHLR